MTELTPIEPSEIEKRNSFELKALDETLHELKEESFYNLYDNQRHLTGVHKVTIPFSSLQREVSESSMSSHQHVHYVTSIPYEFVYRSNRIAYRRSSLYKKEIDIHDISKNPQIFHRVPALFIDGYFYDFIKILPDDDTTKIIIDLESFVYNGVNVDEFIQDKMDRNVSLSVLFLPNNYYGMYITERTSLEQYQDLLSIPDIKGHLNTELEYISFVRGNGHYLFKTRIMDETFSPELNKFNTGIDIEDQFIHLNVFGFINLKEIKHIPIGDRFFNVKGSGSPVPTENIILFRKSGDGKLLLADDADLKLYYPNVYEITGNWQDEMIAYIFYSNEHDDKLRDATRLYRILMDVVPNSYKGTSLSDTVKLYDEKRIVYSIKEYTSSIFNDSHLKYKLNKLKDLIAQDPTYYKKYLAKLRDPVDGYYIDMSKTDYVDKIRLDNSEIVSSKVPLKTFTEEHVVVILNCDLPIGQGFRFFIDGNFYVPVNSWKVGIYQYVYIPKRILTSMSLLEVETFQTFKLKRGFTPTAIEQHVEVELKEDVTFYANDIYVIDKTTSRYLDEGLDYKISIIKDVDQYIPLPTDSFRIITNNKFLIEFINTDIIGHSLMIYAARTENLISYEITTDTATNESFNLLTDSYPDKRHFRVFKRGRLLQQNIYSIFASKDPTIPAKINPNIVKLKGDIFALDYTPHRYNVVHSARSIPADGLVDLKGKIDKPLDLRWFDIYLNGRRLTKNQVFISTPTVMTIYNVNSLDNLLILERDRDNEVIPFNETHRTVIDNMIDEDPVFRKKLTVKVVLEDDTVIDIAPINPTETDIITEIIETDNNELLDMIERVFKRIGFINPDLEQLTRQDYLDYKDQFLNEHVMMINPDYGSKSNKDLVIRYGFEPDWTDGSNSTPIK